MSGLAHTLEEEGIATAAIALLRPHAEAMRPPRALWVPFELGRPLGVPNRRGFQRRVLLALLELLERDDGPVVLEDFPDDAPDAGGDPGWRCPIELDATDLVEEVAQVRPWYDRAKGDYPRTTVGLSGMTVEDAARYLAAVDGPAPVPNPGRELVEAQRIRFAADDLKAFYLEAALAGPGHPSGPQLREWLWTRTVLARTVHGLRAASRDHPDESRRLALRWLVPDAWLEDA